MIQKFPRWVFRPHLRFSSGRVVQVRIVLAAVFAAACSAAFASTAEAEPRCTVFLDATVVDVIGGILRPKQDVVVRGAKIASVRPASRHSLKDCQTVDAKNRFLIPGLVETHVHFSGYSRVGDGDRNAEDAILRLLLANGVTTAVVMEGTPAVLELRRELAEGRRTGPTLYSAGRIFQASHTGGLPGRPTFDTPEQVRREIEDEKRLGYDFVKVHGAMPPETYAALLETAGRLNMPVIGHVPDNLGLQATLDGGQVMIAHAESYLQTYFEFNRKLPTDPVEIDSMVRDASARTAKAGIYVQPTLSVFRQIITQVAQPDLLLQRPEMHLMPASAIADWMPPTNPYLKNWTYTDLPHFRAEYRVMEALVRGLRDAGVPLLVGTDAMCPMQLPGFSMRDEMQAMQAAGLTPAEVLKAATHTAARYLKKDTVSGQVAPGMAADLVLLDANPLDDTGNAFRQGGVMLRGTWYPEAELQRELWSRVSASRSMQGEQKPLYP
jgi:imidazolonepropionase-like amidohydrolase